MAIEVDQDGTPPRRIYYPAVAPRLVSEMLGLAKGMICDGVVTPQEAQALYRWVAGHPDILIGFPGKQVADRLMQIFADGVVDPVEQEDLRFLLEDLVGEDDVSTSQLNHSTRLPLDEPQPTLVFDGYEYVFTGKFACANRGRLERAVAERGGRAAPRVTRQTNFLVIGTFSSPAWVETTHGRKIQRALELRDQGFPIAIIGEEHWVQAVDYDAH